MLNATWLLKVIMERGPISFKDINERWIANRMNEGNSLPRSTFNRYRNEIEDFYDLNIECDKYYRYYVANPRVLDSENIEGWIFARMSDDLILMESDDVRQRIMLEPTPSASFFLKEIIRSMKKNRVIRIDYKKYDSEESELRVVKPYYLKLYHQRWYLVAKNKDDEFRTFGLDRIVSMEETDEEFQMDKGDTAAEYFRHSYGVVVDDDVEVCQVVLRAYDSEPHYLRDLPLHASQKELKSGKDYTDFEYRLRPSLELMGKILERGDRIEVIGPKEFREQILRKLESTVKKY